MTLAHYALTTTPTGVELTINGQPVDAQRVIVDVQPGVAPTLTVWAHGGATGEGVIHVVRDPTPKEIDEAAVEALTRVNPAEFERRCTAKVQAGRRDPYRVALEVLREMADG